MYKGKLEKEDELLFMIMKTNEEIWRKKNENLKKTIEEKKGEKGEESEKKLT